MPLPLFRRLAALAAWACLAAILAGSFLPGSGPPPFPGADKVEHMVAYMAFAASWCAAGVPRWRRMLLVVVLAALVGGLIELVQPGFGRDADVLDLLADLTGAALGVPLALLAARLLARGGDAVS